MIRLLWTVYRRRIHLPGAAATLSRVFAQDGSSFIFELPAAAVDDFFIVPELHAKLLWIYNLRGGPL
ncbi:MAG: hypothetical protein WCF22_09345 [Candidatus Sulfotelmatobacter sp.]